MAITTRVTKSGQITIPAEIRRRIGLKPGDTVIWGVNERGRAEVQPVQYTLEEMDGILPVIPGSDDFDAMIKKAFEAGIPDKIREYSGPDE